MPVYHNPTGALLCEMINNVWGQKFEIVENEENLNFVIFCQKKSFKIEFNTFNFVKFDSRLVLFPSIFQFQNTFVPKKLYLCFCDNSVKINCQNFDKTWWFRQHSWWIKHFPEIIRFFLVFMYPIRFIKLSSKLFFFGL